LIFEAIFPEELHCVGDVREDSGDLLIGKHDDASF
jgi:hypothetical protein